MLHFVKGDVFEFCLTLIGTEPELVTKVVLQSKSLGWEIEATREDDYYRIREIGEVTKLAKPGFHKYEIVITLVDGQELTVKRDALEVLSRTVQQ